jgi:glycerol-3-phosphate acyltransferase PlsY
MHFSKTIICIISITIGYLIGSILPGYFFGRLKGIDIRKIGTHNAGTVNVKHSLGLLPAIPTAIFDSLKGLLSIFLAYKLGANFYCAQTAGLAAIIGHVLPFYLKFKGGQGIACATGIMIFYLIEYIIWGIPIISTLLFLLTIVLIFTYVAFKGEIVGSIVLPLLCYSIIIHNPKNPYNIFFCILITYIFSIGVYNIVRRKLFKIKDKTLKLHYWRVVLRPFAILFIIFYLYEPQRETLILIGSVALVFITLDIIRFLHQKTNELFRKRIKSFFKRSEYRKFSSMTTFLVATFITVLVFEKQIAIAAITFLIFGDIFSKIFGLSFGRRKIFYKKTLEGSLAYFGGALICSYILYTTLGFSFYILVIGSITAAIAEAMPLGPDDNFPVALISGATMTVANIFGL